MEQQTKQYQNEINLYELWKVIVKRKRLIIGLILVAVILTAIISSLMPKIYRGESAVDVWQNEYISARELIEIMGNFDKEKRIAILQTTHDRITDIRLRPLRESKDKFLVIIDAKDVDVIPKALSELLDYVNKIDIVKMAVTREREKLLSREAELSEMVRTSSELVDAYHKLLISGKLLPIGFNPADLNKKIADIKLERIIVSQALNRIQNGCVEAATAPYVSSKPVKPKKMLNVTFAGITSLLIGIFLAFFMDRSNYKKAE